MDRRADGRPCGALCRERGSSLRNYRSPSPDAHRGDVIIADSPGRIIGVWLYAGQRDARTSGPPVRRLAAGPAARTTARHRPRLHSTGAAHEDSPRPPAILQVTPVSKVRQRSVLARRHDMRLILRLSLQMLFGALLLERLARLLGKMLSGRFVGHGYSLRGSPPGSLAPPYAGRAVLVITEHPQTETFAHPPHIGDSMRWAVERRYCTASRRELLS